MGVEGWGEVIRMSLTGLFKEMVNDIKVAFFMNSENKRMNWDRRRDRVYLRLMRKRGKPTYQNLQELWSVT